MTSNLKFRLLTIIAVILVCVYGIIGLPKSKAELIQNWKSNIRLGLDLSGGSHLVLEIHLQDAFKGEADSVIARLKDAGILNDRRLADSIAGQKKDMFCAHKLCFLY